ncbi:hypothetical protein B8P98_15095 [Klebsiella quasivariicola]|nr:hypothetical protein B8P98_15095 [Klebsiella quasivariicola]
MAAPVVHLYLTSDFFVKYRADKPPFRSTLAPFCELIHKNGPNAPVLSYISITQNARLRRICRKRAFFSRGFAPAAPRQAGRPPAAVARHRRPPAER